MQHTIKNLSSYSGGWALVLAAIFVFVGTKASAASANAEAKAANLGYFNRTLAKCGSSYFYVTNKVDDRDPASPLHSAPSAKEVVEYRGVTFDYKDGLRLHDYDKLNGLQWRGHARMYSKAMRSRDLDSQQYSWGNWGEPVANTQRGIAFDVPIRKVKGLIYYNNSTTLNKISKAPSCSELHLP